MPGRPSQASFAAIVGISRNSVTRYEADEPGTDKPIVLIRWAEVTGFDQNWIEHGSGGAAASIPPDTAGYLYPQAA
jgi:transcriptional regulator with XRE-family HTH domain